MWAPFRAAARFIGRITGAGPSVTVANIKKTSK
jgi:hypothetical protein